MIGFGLNSIYLISLLPNINKKFHLKLISLNGNSSADDQGNLSDHDDGHNLNLTYTFVQKYMFRFSSLTLKEKGQATILQNEKFLLSFLGIYHQWNPKYLYNINEGRKIPNYLSGSHPIDSFTHIVENLRIAWLTQPSVYIHVEDLEGEHFFNQLLRWLEEISGQKVFEYAHKMKDKADPQENFLWFNHQSYQQLQSWLANQFQKTIIKSYFKKKNFQTTQKDRIDKLKALNFTEKTKKNQVQWSKLLEMTIKETKDKNGEEFQSYQQRVKNTEVNMYEEIALQIQEQQTKKQKKKRNRKKKGKSNEKSKIKEEPEMKEKYSTQNKIEGSQKFSQLLTLEIEEKEIQEKNSGQSHPQLRTSPEKIIYKKRSLSPDEKDRTFMHEKITKLTNEPNEDEYFADKSQFQNESLQTDSPSFHLDKRRKKKKHKNHLLKQASSKISTCLLNRQLNNFIDDLSIQTNNLYDHKVVCFERIRFFTQSIFASSQAVLFGSNAVGLSLPTSDIDIILFNLPCVYREEAAQILAHLAIQINTMGWIVSCSAYLGAKVPLIKLQIDPTINYFETKRKCDSHTFHNYDPAYFSYLQLKNSKKKDKLSDKIIKVDVTVNWTGENNIGSESTELMRNWMSEYPQMHRIILAFKYILAQRNFNSNFKGGIGSYCLFIMVAAYLKEKPQSTKLEEIDFFMSILKFYGEEFQNQMKSILLRDEGNCFISIEETLQLIEKEGNVYELDVMNNLLRIFDPLNNRIMSGSCFQYNQIKVEFRRIFKEISQAKENAEKQFEMTFNPTEASKLIENKKTLEKWVHKYEIRTGFSMKDIFDGGL